MERSTEIIKEFKRDIINGNDYIACEFDDCVCFIYENQSVIITYCCDTYYNATQIEKDTFLKMSISDIENLINYIYFYAYEVE